MWAWILRFVLWQARTAKLAAQLQTVREEFREAEEKHAASMQHLKAAMKEQVDSSRRELRSVEDHHAKELEALHRQSVRRLFRCLYT